MFVEPVHRATTCLLDRMLEKSKPGFTVAASPTSTRVGSYPASWDSVALRRFTWPFRWISALDVPPEGVPNRPCAAVCPWPGADRPLRRYTV